MEERRRQSIGCFLFDFFYILDTGPVKMALARVLLPPEISQAEVEFPRAPDPPKSGLNGTDQPLDVCLILACMQMIVFSFVCFGSPGVLP